MDGLLYAFYILDSRSRVIFWSRIASGPRFSLDSRKALFLFHSKDSLFLLALCQKWIIPSLPPFDSQIFVDETNRANKCGPGRNFYICEKGLPCK